MRLDILDTPSILGIWGILDTRAFRAILAILAILLFISRPHRTVIRIHI